MGDGSACILIFIMTKFFLFGGVIGMKVLLPLVGGIIGSSVTVFWTEIKNKSKLPWSVRLKYISIGGVSGFVAVNLLNPDGNFSAKAPLAILAGLSPMSFLKGQALNDGKEDEGAFKLHLTKYTDLFNEEIEPPDGEEDESTLVKKYKKQYTKTKGDGYDDE